MVGKDRRRGWFNVVKTIRNKLDNMLRHEINYLNVSIDIRGLPAY